MFYEIFWLMDGSGNTNNKIKRERTKWILFYNFTGTCFIEEEYENAPKESNHKELTEPEVDCITQKTHSGMKKYFFK